MTSKECEKRDPLDNQQGTKDQRKVQAIGRVGHAINLTIERFMAIGEIIAEDNPEIKLDMFDCCKQARDAGKSIEQLCEYSAINENTKYSDIVLPLCDQNAIVLTAKSLLSSITRVLLLVDIVVVKQLLTAKKKVTKSLRKLESVMNFTEFVRAYSVFGMEMIELSFLIGNQQNSLKEERRRAQMYSARQILEHSITILLTSSKTCLLHSDCGMAKENRDTVFCQIRRAMDLIHFVVKDSIFDPTWLSLSEHATCYRTNEKGTVYSTLKDFTYLMERFRFKNKSNGRASFSGRSRLSKGTQNLNVDDEWIIGSNKHQTFSYTGNESNGKALTYCGYMPESMKDPTGPKHGESAPLLSAELIEESLDLFDKLLEKVHDFTDSAYTSHENRESILILCENCKIELNKYLNIIFRNEQYTRRDTIDTEIDKVLSAVQKLSEQLVIAVADQVADLHNTFKISVELVNNFQAFALKQDWDHLQEHANKFHDYCDHIIDVSKLLQHIAFTESLQVQVKCLSINLRIYGPQVITAAKILTKYPSSVPANENLDAFVEMWKWLIAEITSVTNQVLESTNELIDPNILEKYKLNTTTMKTCLPGQEEEDKSSYNALENKGLASETAAPTDKWNEELSDNDILKRAKNMSAMAFAMYQFTKGNGSLRTTQDLFTQAEYFAEEANRLYKVLRQFSYQVPASENKKDLLNTLDRVPTFVQTLQFTVKDHTVGKAATFVKVDHVIRETKSLMSVINKVVSKCFECANKYNLDFTGLSGGMSSGSVHGDESSSGMGDSKGTTNSTEGSM